MGLKSCLSFSRSHFRNVVTTSDISVYCYTYRLLAHLTLGPYDIRYQSEPNTYFFLVSFPVQKRGNVHFSSDSAIRYACLLYTL